METIESAVEITAIKRRLTALGRNSADHRTMLAALLRGPHPGAQNQFEADLVNVVATARFKTTRDRLRRVWGVAAALLEEARKQAAADSDAKNNIPGAKDE